MITGHLGKEETVRLAMAAAMIVVAIASFVWPRCFAGVAGYFTRWAAALPPAEQERLTRVVEAREDAEGISASYGRYLGVAAIVFALLELVHGVPFVFPYALFCLAAAGTTLLAYLQFRRAAERRVAPLVRRSPLTALPPIVLASMACSLLATIALATYPPERISALLVAAATLLLAFVAWRIAVAPALLVGVDPQLEYAVDERVRIGRARNVANLACAPGFVLVALTQAAMPPEYATLGSATMAVAAVAFVITLAASLIPLRGRIRAA